jgi:Transposase DDE domain
MVSQSVGYDAGKQIKGRKRFMTFDTLGLVLRVLVTAANVPERSGGEQVLKRVKQMDTMVSRLTNLLLSITEIPDFTQSCIKPLLVIIF